MRGWLFTPADTSRPHPALVMIPGFSVSTRFEVFDEYAQALADSGVAALLVDAVGFGISGGEPRHHLNVWKQARDYRSGIDFLDQCDDIDSSRIGVWGVSLSTAIASVVAAVDTRVAAVVLLVPAFGDELGSPPQDDEQLARIRTMVLETDFSTLECKLDGPHTIVSPDQIHMPSYVKATTSFPWFINFGCKYGTGWENKITMERYVTPAPFDPQLCATSLKAPVLMLVAEEDEMENASSAVSRAIYERIDAPKCLVEIGGGHFGALYPNSTHYEASVNAQRSFLSQFL